MQLSKKYNDYLNVTPWHDGGKTDVENGEMLCRTCNREKSGR